MKVLITISARSNSSRFPNKIYQKIGDKTILERIYASAKSAESDLSQNGIDCFVIVCGPKGDEKLLDYCTENKIPVRLAKNAEENDLVGRLSEVIDEDKPNYIVRLTADCAFHDVDVIAGCVKAALGSEADYCSNTIWRTFPEGQDIQVCSLSLWNRIKEWDTEHPFSLLDSVKSLRDLLNKEGYMIAHYLDSENPACQRTSIDTRKDYEIALERYKQNEADNTGMARSLGSSSCSKEHEPSQQEARSIH